MSTVLRRMGSRGIMYSLSVLDQSHTGVHSVVNQSGGASVLNLGVTTVLSEEHVKYAYVDSYDRCKQHYDQDL